MPSSNVPWASPLTRLNPWYPGQFGVPGAWTETGLRLDTNGAIFYVDPNAVGVSDGRDGTDPTEPLATIAAALTHCGAYQNDVIAVASSAYWTYANPTVRGTPVREEVTVNVPGVRIVGLAPSSALGVPWLVTQNNGVAITIDAMDVLVEGFLFWEDTYTGATAILAEWDGPPWGESVVIRNCWFGDGLAYGVRLDYSWNALIHNCVFQEITTAAINSVDNYGDPDYAIIHDNVFVGNTAAIDLEDSSACTIYNNWIQGTAGGTNNFIDLTGGANNLVANNYLSCTIAQYDVTCSDAGSGAWINNHCTNGDPAAPPV